MTILTGELNLYRSQVVNDGSTNGGTLSSNIMISGVVGNMFPSINDAERAAGSIKYRKVFCKVDNAENLSLFSPKLFMDKVTPGEDLITFFPATMTDTQAALTGTERQYGGGVLNAAVVPTAVNMAVLVEDGLTEVFKIGDKVRISDKVDLNDTVGHEEIVDISAASTAADLVSMTFSPPLQFAYAAGGVTRVSSLVLPPDEVKVVVANVTVTSAAGHMDDTKILGDDKGSIEQVWTCLFTSPTAFNITGDRLGAIGSGTTGSGAAPNNAAFGTPYFTMQAAGFTGTWVAGNTIVFTTHPCAVPLWFKRQVPVGAAPLANNRARFVFAGESAA